MAFDPSSVTLVEDVGMFDPNSRTILAPEVNVPAGTPKFDPTSASKVGGIPFSYLIKNESNGSQFNRVNGKTLVSSKGAIGISQILPSTAKDVAKSIGIPFDMDKLNNDAAYNQTLGEAYYNKLLTDFEGDDIKAAAAYNAGPARVKAITSKYGDKWEQKLPAETQNYLTKLRAQMGETQAPVQEATYTPVTSENPMIDYNQLQEAGTFGAGAGALIAAIPQARAIKGAIGAGTKILPAIAQGGSLGEIGAAAGKGLIEGVIGSTAGQIYQYGQPENLQNDLTRMGIEMASGGATTGLIEGGLNLTKKAANLLPDWAGQFITKPLSAISGKTELERKLLDNAFGRLKMQPGTATDVFTSATNARQAKDLAGLGIQVPAGETPTNFFRKQMVGQLRTLESQGVKWKDSGNYQQLMAELDLAKIPKDIKDSIRNVANQQGSSLPEAAVAFEQNLLNLAQQSSGDFKVKDMAKIATDLLRKNLDGYFLSNTGVPYYSKLKSLEAEGFAATARDSIPTLIANGFAKNEDTIQSLKNIKKSPGGVGDLKIAVNSYLRTVPEDKIIKQWNDLESVLKETKALPLEDILALRRQVNVSKSLTSKAGVAGKLLVKDAIVSALSSEKARMTKDKSASTITDLFGSNSNEIMPGSF